MTDIQTEDKTQAPTLAEIERYIALMDAEYPERKPLDAFVAQLVGWDAWRNSDPWSEYVFRFVEAGQLQIRYIENNRLVGDWENTGLPDATTDRDISALIAEYGVKRFGGYEETHWINDDDATVLFNAAFGDYFDVGKSYAVMQTTPERARLRALLYALKAKATP